MGKHTFKGGVDYIWNPVEGGFFEFSSTLEIDFAAIPTAIIADPGQVPQQLCYARSCRLMAQANGDPNFIVATKQFGAYFQDDWKVTRA